MSRSRETDSNGLWECKLTPAYGTCQEGNTTGCILNNDGAYAGVADLFSTRVIHGAFTIAGDRLEMWVWGVVLETRRELAAQEGAVNLGDGGAAKGVPGYEYGSMA